jgi:GNAT superfamily N-acetyltransferase
MTPVTVAALIEPTAGQLADVAAVFDQYRQHYRCAVVPGQTLAWMRDQIGSGRMNVFTARSGDDLAGLATTVCVPASLTLSCSWQLRDLYVVPDTRRQGIGRALVGAVRAAAEAAGAIRLSVQTEPGNAAALQLYRASAFAPVEDLCILSLPLKPVPHSG